MAMALALGLAAQPARAAEDVNGYNLVDIQVVYQSTQAGAQRYVAVGCDGSYGSRTGRMQVVSPVTGELLWESVVPSTDACLWSVVATNDVIYASGNIADTDDKGDNLVVEAHQAFGGALLWRKEFEAPNPKQDVVKLLSANQDLALQNGKLLVWMAASGAKVQTTLLRLDAKTGELLPSL